MRFLSKEALLTVLATVKVTQMATFLHLVERRCQP